MSISLACDFCGHPIDDDQPYVTISINGKRSDHRWKGGWVGHYHTGPRGGAADCYERFDDLVDMARQQAGALGAIRVATDGEIAALRSSHNESGLSEARDLFRGLGVPMRAVNGLVRAGVLSLEDVTVRSAFDLLAIPGVGPHAVELLQQAIIRDREAA